MTDQAQVLRDDRAIEEREKVLDWFSTVKHEQKRFGICMLRMDGTGQWLLK